MFAGVEEDAIGKTKLVIPIESLLLGVIEESRLELFIILRGGLLLFSYGAL